MVGSAWNLLPFNCILGNFSLTGIAWAILSGTANETQGESSIAKLEELRFAVGYKTISSDR